MGEVLPDRDAGVQTAWDKRPRLREWL